MLSNTHFLTDFQKLKCRRKMRTRAKSFVLWKKWVTKWLRCLKSPQKLLRAFWQRSRHPIKNVWSKTFRKWGDVLLCQISGFYLNVYYLLSNSLLKIVFCTCMYVCMYVSLYLSIYKSIYLYTSLSIYLSIFLSKAY